MSVKMRANRINKSIANRMKLSRLIPCTTAEYRALRKIIFDKGNIIDIERALYHFSHEMPELVLENI